MSPVISARQPHSAGSPHQIWSRCAGVMLGVVLAVAGPQTAAARPAGQALTATPSAAEVPSVAIRQWNLPSDRLEDALQRFSATSGVAFITKSPLRQGLRSTEVVGAYTISDALEVLLAGTSIAAHFVDAVTVELYPLMFEAEPVVVTAAGYEQASRHAPASVTVLAAAELTEKRVANLAQALADVEGVDTGGTAGKTGGLTVSMRGLPSDYTLVLVDGRRQNAAGNITPNGFGDASTSFMPPMGAIERIEVVRGPMSTLYGSDAMGGVVNVITRRIPGRWFGSAIVDATLQGNRDFGDTAAGNAYLAGPLSEQRLGLAVYGGAFLRAASDLSYQDGAGAEVEISKRGPSPVHALVTTAGGRVSLRPSSDHEMWLDLDRAWQSYDNTSAQLGTTGVQGGYGPEQRFNRQQASLSHRWQLPFGFLDSNATWNATQTLGRTIPPGTPGRVPGDPRTLEARNAILDSRLLTTAGRQTLTAGVQWWGARMVDGVAPAPYEHLQWALFAEDEWRLAARLSLTGGLRYDHHSAFGGHTSPRAYLVWRAAGDWTVKGGISLGFKTPRLDQLADGITGFTGQGTRPTIGSPGLRPETSTSYEISAGYDRGAAHATLTAFANRFHHKIASGPGLPNCSFALAPGRPGCVDYGNWPAVDLFAQSVNVDHAVTGGLEASTRLIVHEDWAVTGNYTYTTSEQKSGISAGQPLVNTPRHALNAAVRWQASTRTTLWLRGEARSERYRGPGPALEALGNYRGYGLLHLGGGVRVARGTTLNLTVYNLLDRDFLRYLPYRDATGAVLYAAEYNNMQEPRRIWMSVSVTF